MVSRADRIREREGKVTTIIFRKNPRRSKGENPERSYLVAKGQRRLCQEREKGAKRRILEPVQREGASLGRTVYRKLNSKKRGAAKRYETQATYSQTIWRGEDSRTL